MKLRSLAEYWSKKGENENINDIVLLKEKAELDIQTLVKDLENSAKLTDYFAKNVTSLSEQLDTIKKYIKNGVDSCLIIEKEKYLEFI